MERPPELEPGAADLALPAIDSLAVGEGGITNLSGTGEPGATVELWSGERRVS